MLKGFYLLLMALILLVPAPGTAETSSSDPVVMRGWIEEMKQSPRGPFKRIRWFCKDGAILPPSPMPAATMAAESSMGSGQTG